MKEIKFRGKRIDNGELVYGEVITRSGSSFSNDKKLKSYIKVEISFATDENLDFANSYLEVFAYEVDPNTIERYTGRKDTNGVEVYELA